MNIYRYSFPIENYDNSGIFFKHVYTKGWSSLGFNELKALLLNINKEQHDKNSNSCGDYDYEKCLDCLDNLLVPNMIPIIDRYFIGTGMNVKTKFGIVTLSIDKITVPSCPEITAISGQEGTRCFKILSSQVNQFICETDKASKTGEQK